MPRLGIQLNVKDTTSNMSPNNENATTQISTYTHSKSPKTPFIWPASNIMLPANYATHQKHKTSIKSVMNNEIILIHADIPYKHTVYIQFIRKLLFSPTHLF